ncbi:ATP-dependent DNA helicase RecG, partial [bacterium]|nr:ATP-dependent DNA helicase RecG [bacterium]
LLLSCFGDLDKSIISEMPPGRVPSKTYFLRESKLEQVYKFCLNQIEKGRQVFVVYPLVEDSEKLDLKSATEEFEKLSALFSMAKVGLIHGKMKQLEKSEIMQNFKKNEIQILVSTTVIEVGIDVPNSTIMIIRHAERFGLSQLHQLRGRIGRGGNESHCFLIAEPKSENANLRIKAMLDTNDGFKLAEVDMKIRGPGDILGTRQSGLPEFKVASLINDEHLLKTAKEAVSSIFKDDPKLQKSENAVLKTSLNQKYHLILSNLS